MRVMAVSGTAFLALGVGAVMIAASGASVAWQVLPILALLLPAILLFRPQPIPVALFCFTALLPVELMKGLMADQTRTIVLSLSPADLMFLGLLPIWHVERRAAGRDIGWTGAHTAFALFLAWMGLSASLSRAPDASLLTLMFYAKYFLFFVVLADLCRVPENLRAALWGGAAGVGFQLLIVAVEMVTGRHIAIAGLKPATVGRELVLSGGLRATRPSGLLNHPNSLAAFLALTLPVMLAPLLIASRRLPFKLVVGLLGLAGFGGLALIATLSRGGWLALAFVLIAMSIGAARHGLLPARRVFGGLLALAMLGGIAGLVHPPILARLTGSDHGSSKARVLLADQAMMMIRENPIAGVGPGAYVRAAQTTIPPSYATVSRPFRAELLKGFVHNKYLLVAAETGLIGLGLFAALLWHFVVSLPRRIDTTDPLRASLALGLSGGIAALCVTFFFEHVAYDVRIGIMSTAAALLVAVVGAKQASSRRYA